MGQQAFDLGQLFRVAQQALAANRQQVNALDGYNGNHGDNMAENLRMISEALQARQSEPPAEALRYAGEKLSEGGKGGTSQYYVQGLLQAANKLEGHTTLDENDVMTLLQTLLGSVPAQGYPQKEEESTSVLEQVMRHAGVQLPQKQQPEPQPQPADDKTDLGDVLERLLPAGLAFLQARQAGADTSKAMQQALLTALLGGQVQPSQASTPREAAGGLIAQSMLQMLLGQ